MSNVNNLAPLFPHRAIFVALCHGLLTRQQAREMWKRIAKGHGSIHPQYTRIYRAATNVQLAQIREFKHREEAA